MATKRITELSPISGNAAHDDILLIHDVSVGSDRRVTAGALRGSDIRIVEVNQSIVAAVSNLISIPEFTHLAFFADSYDGDVIRPPRELYSANPSGDEFFYFLECFAGIPITYGASKSVNLLETWAGTLSLELEMISPTQIDLTCDTTKTLVGRFISYRNPS